MNIAIITGASSGLGIEFLREITPSRKDLDEIWLIARRLERLTEIASEYPSVKCVPISLDLANDESYKTLEEKIDRELLIEALSRLSARERNIMNLRFALDGGDEKTQKEVADMLGISQSYISRLEKKIIRRLRKEFTKMMS